MEGIGSLFVKIDLCRIWNFGAPWGYTVWCLKTSPSFLAFFLEELELGLVLEVSKTKKKKNGLELQKKTTKNWFKLIVTSLGKHTLKHDLCQKNWTCFIGINCSLTCYVNFKPIIIRIG